MTDLAVARRKLEEAAKTPEAEQAITVREAVAEMLADIREMLRAGYTFAEVAELLRQSGVPVTPGTLKHYVRELSSGGASRQPEAAAPDSVAPPAEAVGETAQVPADSPAD